MIYDFAITGDTHLERAAWAKHPEIAGDAFYSFERIIDFCIQHNIPLLILGDIFDSARPPAEAVTFFSRQMDRMAAASCHVYVIDGNHDTDIESWTAVHNWPVSLHQLSVIIGGRTVYGLNYQPADKLAEALSRVPVGTDFLCTHQAWREIQRIGHVDGEFSQIHHARYLLTGDYHTHARYTGRNAQGQPLTAWSPGSIAMQAIDEQPTKWFYAAQCSDPSSQSVPLVVDIPLNTRPFAGHMQIKTPTGLDELISQLTGFHQSLTIAVSHLPVHLRKPICRIQYADNLPEAYNRILAAAGDKFHLFLEPQHVTQTTVVDIEAAPEGAFDNMLTALVQLTQDRPDLRDAMRRLLDSNDPAATAAVIKQEYLDGFQKSCQEDSPYGTGVAG